MPDSSSKSGKNDGGEESAAAGEKHQTEHDSPEPKRTKTTKQTTLDEEGSKEEDKKAGSGAREEAVENETKGEGAVSAVKPSEEKDVASNILEKGIIYFFIRGRVGIEKPEEVNEIARSYILLRPIENDAKLGQGPLPDAGNTRLLALPKKVLPLSGRDRFMVFVEKSGVSFEELKEFLASSDYETKTLGTRHSPAATPVGEGVYVMTTTGRESHLAYKLTLPEKPDEVQKELGLKDEGSFIISTKNPQYPGPANARLPQGPDYPKEVQDEFRSLRWLPSRPKHFNYIDTQILLIGESSGIKKALEPQEEDENEGAKKQPEEVLEDLEQEDLQRMKHLAGDASKAVFADLHARAKDYPKLQTTF